MNCVVLKGRLARDPNIKYSNDMCIASFTIAVNRSFAKKDDDVKADFISCKAFGKTGEVVEKYIGKGREIAIRGRIQTGNYTNKDGNKVYTTDVIAEEIDFCGSKKDGDNNGNGGNGNSSSGNNASAGEGFMNIPDGIDEELPFA